MARARVLVLTPDPPQGKLGSSARARAAREYYNYMHGQAQIEITNIAKTTKLKD